MLWSQRITLGKELLPKLLFKFLLSTDPGLLRLRSGNENSEVAQKSQSKGDFLPLSECNWEA